MHIRNYIITNITIITVHSIAILSPTEYLGMYQCTYIIVLCTNDNKLCCKTE